MLYVSYTCSTYIDSKIRIEGEAMFWLSLQYPYLCPNSKLIPRIKYILIGGGGLSLSRKHEGTGTGKLSTMVRPSHLLRQETRLDRSRSTRSSEIKSCFLLCIRNRSWGRPDCHLKLCYCFLGRIAVGNIRYMYARLFFSWIRWCRW